MEEILDALLGGMEEFGSKGLEIVTAMSEGSDKFKELGPIAEFIAAAFEKTGAQATKIKGDFANIQEDVLSIAAAFISQVEPAVDSILQAIHNGIKGFGPALSEAFKEGKAGELLELSIMVAAEYAGSFIMNYLGSSHFWKGIWDGMKAEFLISLANMESEFIAFGALLKTILDVAVQEFSKHFGTDLALILSNAGKALAVIDPSAGKLLQLAAGGLMAGFEMHSGKGNFLEQFQNNYSTAVGALGAFGPGKLFGQGLDLGGQAATEEVSALRDAMKNASAEDAPSLKALMNSLQVQSSAGAGTNKDGGSGRSTDAGSSSTSNAEGHWHPEFTSLEKMGFVMSGAKVQNPYDQQKITLLQQIRDALTHPKQNNPNPVLHPTGNAL
jgi:hypothetical protein